ncbi:MAG: VOC family protein [Gammaproteobacteria bacterium]
MTEFIRPIPALLILFIIVAASDVLSVEVSDLPSVEASVPFFYYNNLEAAKEWYEHKMGWRKVTDYGWFAVFKVTPTSYLGLIGTEEGGLPPTAKKNGLLSISTNDLGAWYARLARIPNIKFLNGIKTAARGLVEEFKVEDPEGYVIEFFRWRAGPETEHPENPFEK